MAVILSARRSAIVPKGGAFAALRVEDLAAPVLRACLSDAGVAAERVGEVILANALGEGGNPARRAALLAGLPDRIAGLSVDRQCAGGLDALRIAAAMVDAGQADFVLAGGAESASRRPIRAAVDVAGGPPVPYDEAPFTPWPDRDPNMAQAAAGLERLLGITRAQADAWAVASHVKALARAEWPEIVAMGGATRDPFARALSPALAARAPVVTGSITHANTAVAADGAAFCLIAADRFATPHSLRILSAVTLGADPQHPALAPIPAMQAALSQAGLSASEIMQVEMMEAYAIQAIACIQGAGLNPARVNTGGGSLARGHAIGASGAVLAVRLFHDLRAGHGLAAIAAAGGIASAVVLGRSGGI